MNATVYILGILLQATAAVIALAQIRYAPRRLPWVLLVISALLIVGRRTGTLGESLSTGKELAAPEILTLLISLLFFLAILFMTRMFKDFRDSSLELRRNEEKYRTLFEGMSQGAFYQAADGRFTDVNPAALRMFGLTRQEFLERASFPTAWSVIREDGGLLPGDEHPSMAALGTGLPVKDMTVGILNPSTKEYTWAIVNAIPQFRPGESSPFQVYVTLHDITERKLAEKTLNQRTQQLAALNALSSKVNASLELSLVTQAALEETLTAVSPDQAFLFVREGGDLRLQAEAPQDSHINHTCVPGLPVGRRLCGLAVQSGRALYFRDIPTDARCAGETDRNAMVRSFAALPLHSGDEVIGALGLASIEQRDFEQQAIFLEALADQVTAGLQNTRLHETIKQHAAELEQSVARRTEELKVAMERAQDADHLKSAFLATMSHELRTPLNSIIGFTGILLQLLAGPLNEEQTKQLTMIRDSARHLLALINDVLDISKIEAGQLEIVKQPFDLRLAVEDVLQTVMPQAAKKGLSLSAAIASTVGIVESDNRRVKQILINLVSNAVKFTEHGEVHIDCRINEGRLETRIRDTGIGIGQQDMDKLFKPFRQIDTGLTRSHEGTGLGLSICKKLVEMLGGSIRVESEPGVGSTFIFTLPIEQVSGSGGLSYGVKKFKVQKFKVKNVGAAHENNSYH